MDERLATGPLKQRLVRAGCVLMAAGLCGCSPAGKSAAATFEPTATLQELMDSTVDPAADGVWDSVAVYSTAAGVSEHQPRTDEEWKAVRRHAITLIESMNLVVMSGRRAAPGSAKPGLGELTPQEIDRQIAQSHAAFVALANGVRSTARKALEAIDRHDPEALVTAGGDIDEACEACHLTFWYPNQQSVSGQSLR